ncbi:hypothetical protein FKO59_00650 [Burkholderia pseudomallei]|nr:hypothetical protein BOC58_26845 [Burkholderia pseudomallei]MBM5666214.1 hypothetical protein [Burkholderia pseudomallei]PJO61231.1 hypothetical protein CWD85_01645 [Burkholderia pseudomallei]QDH36568.1 hypothetical protein FKO59_00650 [Burkholderia pseudomallei]
MNSAAGIVCKPVGADGAPPPPWIERPIAKRQPASGRSFQRRRRSAAPSRPAALACRAPPRTDAAAPARQRPDCRSRTASASRSSR